MSPIVMSHEQHIAEIMKHWNLLWPLPRSERIKRLNEISADLIFEEHLRLVAEAMAESEMPKPINPVKAGILSGAFAINIGAIFFGGYMIWEMLR